MKKKIISVIILLIIITSIVFLFNHDKKIVTPNKSFSVLIADTEENRKMGLSNTQSLNIDTVKLFIFDKPDYYGFWMKDMLYPIDIVFLDSAMQVISYIDDVDPTSYPETFYPESPALYVMEMNAGERKSSGLDKNIKVYYK
jgi:uncharacterized membrane protein (UPF0127 family)